MVMWVSNPWLGKNSVWCTGKNELKDNIDRSTDQSDITEIVLKMVLTFSLTNPCFYLYAVSFENTMGKGKNSHNEQFLLLPHCFLPFWRTVQHFSNCCLQSLSV